MSTVEEPENHFNIDEYTDVVMVTKPVIYISVQEICDTHTLLLDHRDEIAPDPNDPLHELLDDLGNAPNVDALLGKYLNHSESRCIIRHLVTLFNFAALVCMSVVTFRKMTSILCPISCPTVRIVSCFLWGCPNF